jgi:sec-independent protein translocase protein TatA
MFRNPTTDLIVVLVIVLLIFGPKRLPGLGKQLGTGLREFKESITGENKDEEQASTPEITAASAAPPPQAAASAPPADRQSAEVGPQSRS